jgi:IstB-like ATP binding protein
LIYVRSSNSAGLLMLPHMLKAGASGRATRSVSHQMSTAKFPLHRELAGFDFDVSSVDRNLVTQP